MNAVGHLGISSTSHRIEHLAILLRPSREPSTFESLPTEILVHIARFAHDAHIKASVPTGHLKGEKCHCCNEPAASGGKHVKMAKEVLSLGATSRRIRAVLIHAGFFGSISLKVDADQLFATNVIATDGFLESAKLVDLSLSYRGPNNKPFDAASLRRALNFFSGSEEMIFDWDVTYASSSQKSLPPLPPTCPRILTSSTPKLQTLHLMLQDHNPHYLPSGANPTLLTSRHMSQLLTVVVPPGLKKLELVTHLLTSNMTLAQGFSVFGDSLRGVTCEGLTRLGVTYPYSVDSRQQISHGWLFGLETLLALAPRISSTLSDFQIILKLRFTSSCAFTPNRNGRPTLPGLIPLRHEVIQILRRLKDAQVQIQPFTVGITAEWGPVPLSTPLLVLEYIPETYNTPEKRQFLPQRMRLLDSPEIISVLGTPESRKVFGGDDLRLHANQPAIEDVFIGLLALEDVGRFSNAAR